MKQPLRTTVIDCEDLPTNLSQNPDFQQAVDRAVSRRGWLQRGLGLSAAMFLGGSLAACGGGDEAPAPPPPPAPPVGEPPLLGFAGVAISTADTLVVPVGYSAQVLAPWGTPLLAGAPEFRGDGSEDAAAQALQVGDNHDGLHFFALDGRSDEGLLVMNHEYCTTDSRLGYIWLFGAAGRGTQLSADQVNKAMQAHGVSVIHIRKTAGRWDLVPASRLHRRITASTPMELTGPAAGDALLKTSADPTGTRVLGTLNNCGNGWTPWGTYLTCEENFNNYFGTLSGSDQRDAAQKRYGLSATTSGYFWEQHEDRFDYVKEPNEAHRFGWIVEIDPFDPGSTPKKRTALGRFKHENAAYTQSADGRVVVYMGDDQANDYIYKFVSDQIYVPGGDHRRLLDSGRLYVAVFEDGAAAQDMLGHGRWVLLDKQANPLLLADSRFASQAEVLIHTRLAADAVGATKMDRPEWVAVHPSTGEVYVTLTNNASRTEVNDANPREKNIYGQILRWREAGNSPLAETFEWDLFVLAGNPHVHSDRRDLRSGSANITLDNSFNSPDGLGFDAAGRLWIQTDGKYSNSGDYLNQGNNQMLCADPVSQEIRRFLVGPKECEVTGISFSPDSTSLFINIQHPGEEGNSHWPDGGSHLPRSATVVITKDDGGVIGS